MTRGPETRAELDGCVAEHPKAPLDGAWELDWFRLTAFDPARVIDATCHRCRTVSFELVSLGGAYALRRFDAATGARFETPRVRRNVAVQWWALVLAGAAR